LSQRSARGGPKVRMMDRWENQDQKTARPKTCTKQNDDFKRSGSGPPAGGEDRSSGLKRGIRQGGKEKRRYIKRQDRSTSVRRKGGIPVVSGGHPPRRGKPTVLRYKSCQKIPRDKTMKSGNTGSPLPHIPPEKDNGRTHSN